MILKSIFLTFRPPVSLTMALSPARYGPSLLHSVPPPPILNREPTPKQDNNSDNDGEYCLRLFVLFLIIGTVFDYWC